MVTVCKGFATVLVGFYTTFTMVTLPFIPHLLQVIIDLQ